MASVTVATPVSVWMVVSRTMVRSRYRLVIREAPRAVSDQWPAPSSRIRPNTDGESKRGRHSHSMTPPLVTSAAEWQSDSNA
jgi:hypothetical protein